MRFIAGMGIGVLLLQTGLQLLDVRIEWFQGLDKYNVNWMLAMSLLPFATGIVVGAVYGFGGKYLAHFPPLVLLSMHYYESMYHMLPLGAKLLPWPFWGFSVILMMEFCAVGGVVGELMARRYYGWDPAQPGMFTQQQSMQNNQDPTKSE
jgi:hypothetical protein